MRRIVALLVVACCLSHSNATLNLIKSKLNASPVLRAAIQYLAAPDPIPIPIAYARPAFATHVSAFNVAAVPPVAAAAAATLGVPHHVHPDAIQTTYAAPAVVYPESFPLPAPHVHYNRPDAVVFEPVLVQEHTAVISPPNSQIGNW